jgi:hypothetical protein
MNIVKQILAVIIFISMVFVAFKISIIFGIIFFLGGIYALVFNEAWERPGFSILALMGGLLCRVALSDILLPILRYKTLIDIVIGLFAFGVLYLIGYIVKNN